LREEENPFSLKVNFSRHAQRRAKLYGISLSAIKEIIESDKVVQGKQKIVAKMSGHLHPVKIISSLEADRVTVITIYPLKKGWQNNENTV